MNLDPDLYIGRYVPLESARCFVVKVLPQMGWCRSIDEEVVLDVGCGPGGTTKNLVLPLFQNARKIFAIDAVPGMIALARKENFSPQIEYFIADIEEWSTVKHLENQITKLVSILCFNWLKDQRKAFYNTYRLLKQGGEAAIFFALQGGFFAATLDIQKNPKWSNFFKGVDTFVPESQHMGYGATYYKKMSEEVGFEVLYCKVEERIDVFTSEGEYRKFYTSICVLREYVPEDRSGVRERLHGRAHRKNGRDKRDCHAMRQNDRAISRKNE
ncbi:hypothetical protein AVEN_216001-1 [Araneus ventricosus]|uniref:Methyltransferase type 11 domain-containing protein n=1 Tax=Araneus ventricosus TaxID=182803 RepID=A0A4Y2Q349_ARAVE|nr:hypothetical protein AVEN_216001-1 [Araneus ventricosus]